MRFDSEQPASATPPQPAPALPPWEERHRYGFFNALYLTIREVLTVPDRFFSRMPLRSDLWQPLLFAVTVVVIGAFLIWMWTLTAFSPLRAIFHLHREMAHRTAVAFASGGFFVMSPVIAVAAVFAQAAIVHLCLMLLDAGRAGFEATFRGVAYAHAVYVLAAIPFCGDLIALFWGAAITVVAIRRLHGAETWRAVLAVTLPLLLCLSSCGGVALLGTVRRLLD